jgi:hypothetical protein
MKELAYSTSAARSEGSKPPDEMLGSHPESVLRLDRCGGLGVHLVDLKGQMRVRVLRVILVISILLEQIHALCSARAIR